MTEKIVKEHTKFFVMLQELQRTDNVVAAKTSIGYEYWIEVAVFRFTPLMHFIIRSFGFEYEVDRGFFLEFEGTDEVFVTLRIWDKDCVGCQD